MTIYSPTVFAIWFAVFFAFHSGRTDSNGGHHDRKSGGYHYHNSKRFSTPPGYSSPVSPPSQVIAPRNQAPDSKSSTKRSSSRITARTSKPSPRPVAQRVRTVPPRQTTIPPYQTEIHDGKVMVLLNTNDLVEVHLLEEICKKEDANLVHFYLPGSDVNDVPWAVTELKHSRYSTTIDRSRLPSTFPMRIPGRIESVVFGDTLNVSFDRRIYDVILYGVDCPENHQEYCDKADTFVEKECFRKDVVVVIRGMAPGGAIIGEILLLPDESSLTEQLLREGLAWHKVEFGEEDEQRMSKLSELQTQAKTSGLGLWALREPVSPWEWRKMNRQR